MRVSTGFLLLAFALALTACPGTVTCPEGSGSVGLICVRDGGPDAREDDAPVIDDAGPCGTGCTAPLMCDETLGCVECLSPTDCEAGDLACVMGSCEQCDDDADCDFADTSTCDTTSHTCVACDGPEDCGHGSLGDICDTSGGDGVCVECTAADLTACASGICLLSDNSCAPAGGGTALCGGCGSDNECAAGQLCVQMMYDDPATGATDPVSVGNHCLWREDAAGTGAPGGACSTIRPYVRATSVTSIDGVTTNVCSLAVSTCDAHADFRTVNCMTLDAAGNARCGVDSVPDGICQRLDAASNRCTVYCGSDDDCRAGFSCNTSITPVPTCNL